MITPRLLDAVRSAQEHKAVDMNVLNLDGYCSFTDFFVVCTGTSQRHRQTICDAIVEKLKGCGVSPAHIEGYSQAEWILVDYLHFVVHIFSEKARQFYGLERLWKTASQVQLPVDADQ